MSGTTTRLSLPFPQLTDAADISQAVPPLTTLLDTIMLAYAKGLLSARPAASSTQLGRLYYATDNGITYFCDGAVWQRLDLDALNRIIALEAKIPTAASAFRAEQNAATALQGIGSSTPASFPTVRHALNALSALAGGSSWTIPVTGLYRFDYNILPAGNAGIGSAVVRTFFQKVTGPVVMHAGQAYADSGGNNCPSISGAGSYVMTSGDVVELLVTGQGGSQTFTGYVEIVLERV